MRRGWMVLSLLLVPAVGLAQEREGDWRRGGDRVPPLITVTGTAEASAAPDRATLRVGVTAQAEKASEAQSAVSADVAKVLESLRAAGIAKEDLATAGLSLSPVYSQPSQREMQEGKPYTPRITGYQASNTVQVTINDLAKVGPTIDAAIGAGANQVESLTFDLKNDTEARNEALMRAVERARSKAEVLAKTAGVRLTGLQEMEEAVSSPGYPIPFGGARLRAAAMEAATPIEPGQMRISATVTLRYRFAQ